MVLSFFRLPTIMEQLQKMSFFISHQIAEAFFLDLVLMMMRKLGIRKNLLEAKIYQVFSKR